MSCPRSTVCHRQDSAEAAMIPKWCFWPPSCLALYGVLSEPLGAWGKASPWGAPAAWSLTRWRGQAVHAGSSAACPATVESGPKGLPPWCSLGPSLLCPSVRWWPLCPTLGTPLLLDPQLLSHSQFCCSLCLINLLDVLPFSA